MKTTTASLTAATEALARDDQHGAPYFPGPAVDYWRALAIARSAHPARVLANTNGYRYGRFAEQRDGSVTVTMMGSQVACFRERGVWLSSCGIVSLTTTEALNALVTGGSFGTVKSVIWFRSYTYTPGIELPGSGMAFPYACQELSRN